MTKYPILIKKKITSPSAAFMNKINAEYYEIYKKNARNEIFIPLGLLLLNPVSALLCTMAYLIMFVMITRGFYDGGRIDVLITSDFFPFLWIHYAFMMLLLTIIYLVKIIRYSYLCSNK